MAAKDNISNQFIDVFHSSRIDTPPHEISSDEYFENEFHDESDLLHAESGNPDGDFIFTGTRDSATDRSLTDDYDRRSYLHKYRIPASMVRPETFADDMAPNNIEPVRDHLETGTVHELWETTPAQTHLVTPDSVVRYRNRHEDIGSISHIIHKQSVKPGKIKYLGMEKI